MNFALTLLPLSLGMQILLIVLGISVPLMLLPAGKPPSRPEGKA